MHKILMLSDELRHAPQVSPWAKELTKKDKNELLVVDMVLWPKKYYGKNISYRTFNQYFDKKLNKKIHKKVRSLLRNWNELKDEIFSRESAFYDGIPLFELLTNDLCYYFQYYFYKIIKYIEITKRIIDAEKPDVIVVMDDRSWFGRTVIRVGNLLGVPTLITQHGVHSDAPHYGLTYADKMAVFGEFTKKCLIKRGVSPEKIVVTGGPQWDVLAKWRKPTKEEICCKLGLDENKRIIVLATQPIEQKDEKRRILLGVFKTMKKFPDMQLIIKLHPTESDIFHKSIALEVGANDVVFFKKPHDYDLESICDILITKHSTVALDAMILGKPVITINLSKTADPIPYAESGAAIGVYSAKDIAPAIRSILTNSAVREKLSESRKKFLYEQIYKMDGKASKRVADLIEKMSQIDYHMHSKTI